MGGWVKWMELTHTRAQRERDDTVWLNSVSPDNMISDSPARQAQARQNPRGTPIYSNLFAFISFLLSLSLSPSLALPPYTHIHTHIHTFTCLWPTPLWPTPPFFGDFCIAADHSHTPLTHTAHTHTHTHAHTHTHTHSNTHTHAGASIYPTITRAPLAATEGQVRYPKYSTFVFTLFFRVWFFTSVLLYRKSMDLMHIWHLLNILLHIFLMFTSNLQHVLFPFYYTSTLLLHILLHIFLMFTSEFTKSLVFYYTSDFWGIRVAPWA